MENQEKVRWGGKLLWNPALVICISLIIVHKSLKVFSSNKNGYTQIANFLTTGESDRHYNSKKFVIILLLLFLYVDINKMVNNAKEFHIFMCTLFFVCVVNNPMYQPNTILCMQPNI